MRILWPQLQITVTTQFYVVYILIGIIFIFQKTKMKAKEILTPEIDSENEILSCYNNSCVYLKNVLYLHTIYEVLSLAVFGLPLQQ